MRKNAKYPSQMLDKFLVRMQPALRDAINKTAAANGRSMNSEINLALSGIFAPDANVCSDVPAANDMERLTLRLPASLHEQLTEAAADSGQSLNFEIVQRLASPGRDEMLDRIALAVLPEAVARTLDGGPEDRQPEIAIRRAYETAKRMLAARADFFAEQAER